jgi:fatty acid desaturase
MRPRYAADYRSLLWVVFAIALIAFEYVRPSTAPYLFWLNCYLALACGVMAHNHNHCPTFAAKWANGFFGNVISIFYGYPTFAWIPTHNLNHHKFVNRAGDATITWRYTDRHNLLVAATYPFISGYFQAEPTNAFLKKAREKNPKLYRRIQRQYVVWLGAHALLVGLALFLYGPSQGLKLWCLVGLVPALFALWTIMLFNYEQHVHADPWSKHNHSRSFTSPTLNFLLFNNGYHTVHHEHPGAHWSKLGALHKEIEAEIDPRLMESSVWWYWLRQYFITPFFPKLGSVQVGRAPFDPPQGGDVELATGDVDAAEAGTNSPMLV